MRFTDPRQPLRTAVTGHPGRAGQAIVILSLCIVALSGMLALTVDVGSSFMHRRLLQTAADAGVMAGAHLALEDVIYGQAQTSARYDLHRNTAINFAKYNGMGASDTILVQWVDASGNAFPNDAFNRPQVGAGTVQGMKVSITANRGTMMFQAFGIPTIGVSVNAMAQFGTANALIGPIPLVLNYDTVPRVSGKPVLYKAVLLQTQTGALGGAACCTMGQIDNNGFPIPLDFYSPPPNNPLGPSNFFILHDAPSCYLATCLADRNSTYKGLKSTVQTGVFYYAENEKPASNNFGLGLTDRIAEANSKQVFADNAPTKGGFLAMNPRVFIIGINPISSGTSCTPPCDPNTVSLQINEFLAFYIQFVVFDTAVPQNGITIGGYFVDSTGVPGSTGFGIPTANGPKIFRLTQ